MCGVNKRKTEHILILKN